MIYEMKLLVFAGIENRTMFVKEWQEYIIWIVLNKHGEYKQIISYDLCMFCDDQFLSAKWF